MNRRGFFRRLLLGGTAFTILPGAGRIWRARREIPPHCLWAWHRTSRVATCESDEYRAFMEAFFYGKPLPRDLQVEHQFARLPSITVEALPYQDHLQKLLGVEPTG